MRYCSRTCLLVLTLLARQQSPHGIHSQASTHAVAGHLHMHKQFHCMNTSHQTSALFTKWTLPTAPMKWCVFLCMHSACDITAYPFYKPFGAMPCRMYLTYGQPCFSFVCLCSFEDGLQLVKLRGESMQAAADTKPSAMVSVLGLSSEKACTSNPTMTQMWLCTQLCTADAELYQVH